MFLLAGTLTNAIAQEAAKEPEQNEVCDHVIGVQINGLIKQLVNSSASSASNPYLLTYDMRSKKTGWGFRAGIGYNSISNVTPSTYGQNKVDNTDMSLRVGVERGFKLSKRCSAAVGIDLLFNHNDDFTSSEENDPYTNTFSSSSNKSMITTVGGGPFGQLSYHINRRILVGTEASFYYKTGQKDQTIDNLQPGYGPPTESKVSTTVTGGSFYMPVVFYLSVSF